MSEITPLDAAHAAMEAAPEADALRLRFFERLADGEMFLLLEAEAEGENLTPQVFDLEERAGRAGLRPRGASGRLHRCTRALCCAAGAGDGRAAGRAGDRAGGEPRGGAVLDAAAGQKRSTGWPKRLRHGPSRGEAQPEELGPPGGLPEALLSALDGEARAGGGLAAAACLAGVTYAGGRRGHMLAFVDVAEGAEGALARAAGEALTFSGVEAGEMDVTFIAGSDPAVGSSVARVGPALRSGCRPRPEDARTQRKAPGSDPDRPPILR